MQPIVRSDGYRGVRGVFQQVVLAGGVAILDLANLLADRLNLAEGLAFCLPLGSHGVGFGPEVGQLSAQALEPGLHHRHDGLGECVASPVRDGADQPRPRTPGPDLHVR